jgi:hypothetical protein
VPFYTTAKGAVDITLLQLYKLLAVSDVALSNLVNRLQELHHWQYYRSMHIYYDYAATLKRNHQAAIGEYLAAVVWPLLPAAAGCVANTRGNCSC